MMGDHEESGGRDHMLTNEIYDGTKFVAQILLPGAGTLYFALASIWGLPNGEQVIGSIAAVDIFLGAMLGISTKQYNSSDAQYDGTIDIEKQENDHKMFSLNLDSDPDDLENQKVVKFKVNEK